MASSSRLPIDGVDAADRGWRGTEALDAVERSLHGRFRLERSFDSSIATGRVYAAIETETGTPVAIKLAQPRRASDGVLEGEDAAHARLRREAEVLRQLEGAGAPRVRAFSEQPPCLILERIDGVDLERMLATRDAPPAEADIAALCGGLAEILGAIHARGVLHGDIKPSNILVRDDGAPALLDFGSARRLVAGEDAGGDDWSVTPEYAPPEFHNPVSAIGPWSDVYSLGAVAYRMISGRSPVPALARLRGAPMASAGDAADPPVSEELAALVDWALELDPVARPFSAEEWRQALRRIADDRAEGAATVRVRRRVHPGVRPAGATPRDAHGPTRRPLRVWTVAAGAAALAAVLATPLIWRDLYGFYQTYFKSEWIVDVAGRGDATTIAGALARVRDGTVIHVRPGVYRETVAITRPVELLGRAENGEWPVIVTDGACITVTARSVRISQMDLRAEGATGREDACLDIVAGQAVVESVRVSAASGPGVLARNGAELRLVDTSVAGGVRATGSASLILSGGDIRATRRSGIIGRGGAELRISGTQISGTGEAGVLLGEGAVARIENATIGENGTSAVEIQSGAHATIADSTISGAGQAGIFVLDGGRVEIARTKITGSRLSGLIVGATAEARVEDSTFEDNGEHGILVLDIARTTVANSRIAGNRGHGIAVERGAAAELTGNTVERNREPQVLDVRRSDGSAPERRRGGAS